MTRLHYWLHAKTQYDIHSPFLFEMYREVLFARMSAADCHRLGIPRHDRCSQVAYKCCNHYHLAPVASSQPGRLCEGLQLSIFIVDRPHASHAAERQWETLKADPSYQVSLDLYDIALLIRNPHLHPQHLLLR